LKVILENFARNHERVRRELLELLDRAFAENERLVREELARQSKSESPEFSAVFRKIGSLDQEIERLLGTLRGPEYRRTIAEVVTRDFQQEIAELHSLAGSAKNSYILSLGEVECDRGRLDTIKDNLHRLFYINRRTSAPPISNQVSQHIREVVFSATKPEPVVSQSRTRKSFFNFGGD
jgi:hypothetical protein